MAEEVKENVEEKVKEKKEVKSVKKGAKSVPEYKKKLVADLAEKMKTSKTVLIASTKGLPGGQFHLIKKVFWLHHYKQH